MKAVSFTNEIGQTIEPGEKVIVVTLGRKVLRTRVGTYLGMSDSGYGCAVEVLSNVCVYRFRDTGEETSSHNARCTRNATGREYDIKWEKRPRKTTLRNNHVYAVR